jgi:ribosome biogenesis GTPase
MRDDFLDMEEDFHSYGRKDSKKDRKAAQAKDRSKYKKTDETAEGAIRPLLEGEVMGLVLQVLPENTCLVKTEQGTLLCPFKGGMRYERTQERNLLAVGDMVYVLNNLITYVKPRLSFLYRYENNSNKRQLLACNIDQVFISASVIMPRIKPHLIDRYIIAAKEGNLKPIILFNKTDLLKNPPPSISEKELQEAKELYKELKKIYTSLGIPVLSMSCEKREGFKELKKIMKGKISVFSGQSGVGKTSMINILLGADFEVREVMKQNHKGSHTTTSARLIEIEEGTYCVDTPGIKSFGVGEIDSQKIRDYFEEISHYGSMCKFALCSHSHEPSCAVKEALNEGKISVLRYFSYCNLMGVIPDDEGST